MNAEAIDVVLEIIREHGIVQGKTRLFKAFYFAHLEYYKQNVGILSDWPIARMPNGPGIHKGDQLLRKMEEDGLIAVEHYCEGVYQEYRYRITEKGQNAISLDPARRKAICDTVNYVKDKTCAELSDLTHEHSRSWNQSKDGDLLNIYIDVASDEEYEADRADATEISEWLNLALQSTDPSNQRSSKSAVG